MENFLVVMWNEDELVGPGPAESPRQGAGHRWRPLKKQVGSIRGSQPSRHPDQCMTGVGNDRKAEG